MGGHISSLRCCSMGQSVYMYELMGGTAEMNRELAADPATPDARPTATLARGGPGVECSSPHDSAVPTAGAHKVQRAAPRVRVDGGPTTRSG